MASRLLWLVLIGLVTGPGFAFGYVAGLMGESSTPSPRPQYYPLPHHIAKYPGGVAFRFAMAHDIVHERFPKHGPAHYRERNRRAREKMAALPPDDPAAFPLADDLGAGLERLGQSGEAVVVLRDKLARQQARGVTGRDLYTSYANLGTFLVHTHFQKAVAGDPAARERFREGLDLVKKSVEVNPEAHFGREKWQVRIGEFILAATGNPAVLWQTDFVGNKLDEPVDPTRGRPTGQGGYSAYAEIPAYTAALNDPDALIDPEVRSELRWQITRIGGNSGEVSSAVSKESSPVPFDEPMLGIIGMWRQGGGANPHFALAIGETMLRVGQRYIAWAAFERAYRLAERYWPDPALQQFLRAHCRQRQDRIEASMPDEAAELRLRFEAELAHGESYQKAYQEYEGRKIAAGVPLTDDHLFDEFNAAHPPIASATGLEEWYAINQNFGHQEVDRRMTHALGWGGLGAGVTAFLTAVILRWWAKRATRASVLDESPAS